MTEDQTYAALCAWEYVQGQLLDRIGNYWTEQMLVIGMCQLRHSMIEVGKKLDAAHTLFNRDYAFDWDFVPDMLEEIWEPLDASQEDFNKIAKGLSE